MARRISFEREAWSEFTDWLIEDIKICVRILELVKDIQRDPFRGIGKPEPLKYDLQGFWSRRIDSTHRLVYMVTDSEIIISSCRHHYK
jgi:toxin YoeB